MKANIQLALAQKLNLILSAAGQRDDSKFVAFVSPTQNYTLKYSELVFFSDDPSAPDANAQEVNKSVFAEIVNMVPEDNVVFSSLGNGLLWDAFEAVVNNSLIAKVELNSDEAAQLEEARKFCEDQYPNYRSFKNNLDQCELDYKQAKCSIDYANGAEKEKLAAEWTAFREKQLLDRITEARNDLEVLGKKASVIAALDTVNNLEAKKGIDKLKLEIDAALETFSKGVPNRAGYDYMYTDFAPLGSFSQDAPSWNEIVLYSSEIDSLCQSASPELVNTFSQVTTYDNIESISFEYAIVSVVRGWFFEQFLRSRNWKFALDTSQPVSDGKIPATGTIPAYINRIVCIRKLVYKQKVPSATPERILLSTVSLPVTVLTATDTTSSKPIERPYFRAGALLGAFRGERAKPQAAVAQPVPATQPVSAARPRLLSLRRSMIGAWPANTKQKNDDLLRWRKANIATFKAPKLIASALAPDSTSVEQKLDGIQFVAFECKRLPVSPNPDATLTWP